MYRIPQAPRSNWQERVESLGFMFHSVGGTYWDESTSYILSMDDVNLIEKASAQLFTMCMEIVEEAVSKRQLNAWYIPPHLHGLIFDSWEQDHVTLYGRFDLAADREGNLKLLEFNADTPTSLLEASAVQWNWLEDVAPHKDQFNRIHEALLEQFQYFLKERGVRHMHFSSVDDNQEDFITVAYLMDCAQQAGIGVQYLPLEQIGWNGRTFVDEQERDLQTVFKLYPWEFMWKEEFGRYLHATPTVHWVEPAWKMLLSNKILLTKLWEQYPESPWLLPTYTKPDQLKQYVQKPIWGREGANVRIVDSGKALFETLGDYGYDPPVYQSYLPIQAFDGNRPVIGSWIIGDEPCGIGIRETTSLVHDNVSRFVPHYIDG